jgi:hypothetical protein
MALTEKTLVDKYDIVMFSFQVMILLNNLKKLEM